MTIEQIKEYLSSTLSEKRYRHSLAVADMAYELAKIHSADADKAYLAGLVHDVMREYPADRVSEYFSENLIEWNEFERNAPNLWHAMMGANEIKVRFGIDDPDIINAVRYHTTARAGMSLLEKIIYIADCTSADRNYSDVEDYRRRARTDLDDAVKGALEFCRDSLNARGISIHPDTHAALNEFSS